MFRTFAAAALVAAAGASLCAPASAQSLPSTEIGISAGTLGVGPEVNLRYPDMALGLRMGLSVLDLSHSASVNGIRYSGSVHLLTGGPTVDYYPFMTGMRVSAGALLNGSDIKFNATPSASTRIGGTLYTPAQIGSLAGRATFNTVAPYVGVGYTMPFFGGAMPVSLDVGALYQGTAKVSMSATGPLSGSAAGKADIASETAKVSSKIRGYDFYPVAKLTVAYHF